MQAGKSAHPFLGDLPRIMKAGSANVFIQLSRDLGPVFKVGLKTHEQACGEKILCIGLYIEQHGN
jgi:hypothetical protein